MYAFLRVGSIPVVMLCHSFCNVMGLPDFEFMSNRYCELYSYRKVILGIHVLGIILFVVGFWFHEFLYDGASNIFRSS